MTQLAAAMRALVLPVLIALLASNAHAQSRSLFIEDLTWTEVRDALVSGKDTAIIYAGSTEQNGPHMALGKHNVIARHVAQRIAAALGNALIYPVLPFAPTGDPAAKTGHMRFPGTVSVSDATFATVAREFAQSAIAAGFKNIALMGDHGGGQQVLLQVARELTAQWEPKSVRVYYIADAYVKANELVAQYLAKRKLAPGLHAALSDTSELMALDADRRWVRRDKLAAGNPGNGVDGDPRSATAELGRRLLQIKIDSAVAQIRDLIAQPR